MRGARGNLRPYNFSPRKEIASLDAKSLKGLVLSLVARIDELSEQNKKLLEHISTLLARIAELEGRGGKPPTSPSSNQRSSSWSSTSRSPRRSVSPYRPPCSCAPTS
jgi:hypothetical protein